MKRTRAFSILAMVLLISIAVPLSLSYPANACTTVGGIINVDTIWTKVNNPYIVATSVLVAQGVTLTIEPGVIIRFNSGKGLQVDGQLFARGTAQEHIVFTAHKPYPSAGFWCNILFTDTSDGALFDEFGNYLSGSIMDYCTVNYGGYNNMPVLRLIHASPFITHCTVSFNSGGGINVDSGSVKIVGCNISHNAATFGSGIYAQHSTMTMAYNYIGINSGQDGAGIYASDSTVTIDRNSIGNNTGGGITIYDSTANILQNNIYGNVKSSASDGISGAGIFVSNMSDATISGNYIQDNVALYGGGGIGILSSNASVEHNNVVGNSASSGSAIYVYHSSYGSININDNYIVNNTTEGMQSGALDIHGNTSVNYNSIYNNVPYDIYNSNEQGSPGVDATNNWWGTADESSIQAHIYDWYDDASLGIVNFIPYLTSALPRPPVPGGGGGGGYPPKNVLETSICEEADTDGTVVVKATMTRVKNPTNGETVLGAAIGSYEAWPLYDPTGIELLTIRPGASPFDIPIFYIDNPGGNANIRQCLVCVEPPITVANIVPRLVGSAEDVYSLEVTFDFVADCMGNVTPQQAPQYLTFQRGDINGDGIVNIIDAMFGAQYLVGLRPIEDIHQLNMASVKFDSNSGDIKSIVDCMYIAQYVVGLRDCYFDIPQVVHFPDPNLEAAIRAAIGKPAGDIYQSDLYGLTFLSASGSDIINLTGLEHCTSLVVLSLWSNQISDISPLSGLTKLTSLGLETNQISDISLLSGLTNLTYLDLDINQISDISPLSGLTNLSRLDLGTNQISDISPLSVLMNLTRLSLVTNQVSDISPLSGLTNLTQLWLYYNQIDDITVLAGLTNLTLLSLGTNQISDISPLSGLTNLTSLGLGTNQISDISPLSGLTNLTSLGLQTNQISDISSLSGLTNLTYLNLDTNQISDISLLSGLTNLTFLGLETNQISDISPLSGLTNLTGLNLSTNPISDISPLSGLTNLTELILLENQMSDISPLSGLTNLTNLWISCTQISDISPLSGLTNLTQLWLYYNQIDDITVLAGLTNLEVLNLDFNQIDDISPLVANSGLAEGDTVYLAGNPLSQTSIDTYIPQLQARGVIVSY